VEEVTARKEDFARALCMEAGKAITDARGEVQRLIDTFKIAAGTYLAVPAYINFETCWEKVESLSYRVSGPRSLFIDYLIQKVFTIPFSQLFRTIESNVLTTTSWSVAAFIPASSMCRAVSLDVCKCVAETQDMEIGG
jgi:hypothetical protein